MNRPQVFMIISFGGKHYALPAAMANQPLMQVIPNLRPVKQTYDRNYSEYLYLDEGEQVDIEVKYKPVYIAQEKPVPPVETEGGTLLTPIGGVPTDAITDEDIPL